MSRISILQKYISNTNPIIVEAGIHKGEDTRIFKQIWPEAVIYAFEPDPRNVKELRTNGVLDIPGIHFSEFALSDSEGASSMFLSDMTSERWSASSSLNAPKEHLRHFPHINFDQKAKVRLTTLDKELPDTTVDIIWLDVQGHELSVIRGGKSVLSRTKLLYLEYYNVEMYEGQPKVKDMLDELGPDWEIVEIWPSELLLRNKQYN